MISKLQIPSAIPYILTGLRISVGLATIGAIVGEFIAGGGLGSLIDSARTQQRVDLVFSGVMASSVLALLLVLSIDLISGLLLRRRPVHEECMMFRRMLAGADDSAGVAQANADHGATGAELEGRAAVRRVLCGAGARALREERAST